MRFGSRKVPVRVMLAVITLAGLGAVAAFPDQDRSGVNLAQRFMDTIDPMFTASGQTDTSEPVMTQMPGDLEAETSTAPMSDSTPPRQVLPGASTDTSVVRQPEQSVAPSAAMPTPATSVAVQAVQPVQRQAAASPSAQQAISPTMTDTHVVAFNEQASMQVAGLHDTGPAAQQQGGYQSASLNGSVGGNSIILALDHARVMRLAGEVSTIIIGNPAIADANMPDPRTVVLTGKSYGETNLVLLDENGSIIAEQMLRVTVRGQSLVSVYRGVQRQTLSCSPTCEIRPTPGDNTEQINAGLSAFEARNAAALEAARSR